MSLEPALKIVIPSDSTPSKSIEGNNKKIVGILVALCGLAALGLGYYWFAYGQSRISTDNAYIETDIHSVSSRIMGYVKEVSVKESEVVKKGQLLALLDDSDFSMELIFKKVKLKKAVADFRRAKQLLRAQAISRADFELAEAGMAAAQADVDMTGIKIKYTRIVSPVDGVVGKKNIESGQFAQPGQGLFVILPHGPL
jgi:RND family efflux transporter MFP subunit